MNGYDAQDMATQGADGFRKGYQAGYADAVKAVEVGKPVAAQEAGDARTRLHEIAYRDSAVSVMVRIADLRAVLAAPAVQEAVAVVSAETFNSDGTSDIIKPALPIGTKLYAAPVAAAPVDVFEAYKTWPVDLRAKLSAHDLRRMNGWAPPISVGEWRIDTSAGGPILVYKNCSVIEGEDARYVLSLIHQRQRQVRSTQDGKDWNGYPVGDTQPPAAPGIDLVDRVAMALHANGADSITSDTPWSELHDGELNQFRSWARAALVAARPQEASDG